MMTSDTGMRDVVACSTKISDIIDDTLSYVGYDIAELVDKGACFEEVIYLLWHLKLPKQAELDDFRSLLQANYAISDAVEQCILIQSRKHLHPMSVLRSTVSLLGVYNVRAEERSLAATYEQCLKIMAQVPTIIATFARLRKGLPPIAPRQDLGFAANFLYMLNGSEPSQLEIDALDQALILHAEHGMNASTFAARVTASTLSDTYSCVTTAIGALKGPLHGGANEKVFDMLSEILASGDTIAYLRQKLNSREKIMGFGHRVYRTVDPRQRFLKKMAHDLTLGTDKAVYYQISQEIEDFIRQEKGLIPNVDFYSATVYHVLGIDSDIFTLIFAMSRMSGWLAHIHEQQANNQLIRPKSHYTGPTNQAFTPIERRG